jgi:dTDP-4-dehydrorhamnose reductase
MKPTILLTGKTGQLGSELNRLLPKLGEVIAPERTELDLREPEKIHQIMGDAKPQLVVNSAAYTAVDAAEADQANALAVNADSPRLLAQEAKRIGAVLVHFMSSTVRKNLPTSKQIPPTHSTRTAEPSSRANKRFAIRVPPT